MTPERRSQTLAPAEDALELARRLLATDLGPDQRILAEGIRDAAEAMAARPSRATRGRTVRTDATSGGQGGTGDSHVPAPAASLRTPRGRGRILVVDDSESNRLLALLQLDRLGFDAVAVGDGWAALERLAEEPFDLVLLDGMMPGLDGPGTAREIRRREISAGLQRMPIVALTASILPEDRAMVLEAGMDDHLAKPIRIEELARVLDMRLAEAPSQRGRLVPAPAGVPTGAPEQSTRDDADETVVDGSVPARLADLGDPQLTARLVRLFLADAEERVRQVDAALAADDTVRLRAALEALEGTCNGVGAVALLRRAHELHDCAIRMDRDGRAAAPAASGLGDILRDTRAILELGYPVGA
jgi:two-component system sensor histidine kinase BarA